MSIARFIYIARISEVRTNCERAPTNPVGMQSSRSGQQLSILSEIIRFRGLLRGSLFSPGRSNLDRNREILARCHGL